MRPVAKAQRYWCNRRRSKRLMKQSTSSCIIRAQRGPSVAACRRSQPCCCRCRSPAQTPHVHRRQPRRTCKLYGFASSRCPPHAACRLTSPHKSRPRAATLALRSCPRQWEGEPLSRWQGRYPPFASRGLRVSPSTCLMLQWKLRYAGVTSALEGPNVSSTTRRSGAIHATEYATRHARCCAGGNDAGQGHLTSANGGDHD